VYIFELGGHATETRRAPMLSGITRSVGLFVLKNMVENAPAAVSLQLNFCVSITSTVAENNIGKK
jgi:hypothetical protein